MATEILPALPRVGAERTRPRWTVLMAGAPPRSAATAILVPAAALLMVSGALHLDLWSSGYRGIPTIGPLFLAQGIATFVIAAVLLMTRWLAAVVVALGVMVGTVGGFILAGTVGLFGFYDGFAAPHASVSFAAEVTAIVLLLIGGSLVVRRWVQERTRALQDQQVREVVDEVQNPDTGDHEPLTIRTAPISGLPPRRSPVSPTKRDDRAAFKT
jgi:hypothetical protein